MLAFALDPDQRLTFKQVDDTTNALASQLQETYGIHLGDRVSISMRIYPEWCLAFVAVTRMGQWKQGLLLRPRALCHGKGGMQ